MTKSEQFRQMFRQGKSIAQIAKETNSNYSFVYTVIKRLSDEETVDYEQLHERLSKLQVSHLSDAMGRTGVLDGLHPVNPQSRLVARAFTVRAMPGDNLTLHWAVTQAQPGEVIVVDAGGLLSVALWGELMSLAAQARGIAGLVIDGAIRDQETLATMDFPVYAKGSTPRGPVKASMGEINTPISCGGVVVKPGDLIVGDADGVAVIPQEKLDAILSAAEAIAAKEEMLKEKIARGERLFDLLNLGTVIR